MNEKLAETLLRRLIFEGLGFASSDPNLRGTPKRMAKMYCKEFFANHNKIKFHLTTFPNTNKYDQIIMLDNIPFTSICSHHFLPFQGLAWLLYIPKDRLVGASKAKRLIDFYSKRPQLQENLTNQIVGHFTDEVRPVGVMLVMRATHGCMSCRGVKAGNKSGLVTSEVTGPFRTISTTRQEANALIALSIHPLT